MESNPVPLPDLYLDFFSYPVASIVFGDMAIVPLFLLLFFLANPRSCLEKDRLAEWRHLIANSPRIILESLS